MSDQTKMILVQSRLLQFSTWELPSPVASVLRTVDTCEVGHFLPFAQRVTSIAKQDNKRARCPNHTLVSLAVVCILSAVSFLSLFSASFALVRAVENASSDFRAFPSARTRSDATSPRGKRCSCSNHVQFEVIVQRSRVSCFYVGFFVEGNVRRGPRVAVVVW